MKKKTFGKFLNSLLIFTLFFSLLNPLFAAAETGADFAKKAVPDESILQMKEMVLQQQALLEQAPALHPELQNVSDDQEVTVIVQLSEEPVALEKGKKTVEGKTFTLAEERRVLNKVNTQQSSFEKEMKSKNIHFSKEFTYNQVFNGMSLTVKGGDVEKLLEIKGVVSVEPDAEVNALEEVTQSDTVSPAMLTSNSHLEVPKLWEMGVEGEGVKVAVLDTGIDYTHPEFAGVYKGGFNFVAQTGNSNYASDRADDDPYETSPEERPDHMPEFNADGRSFYTSHGTHVAGTIAATGENEYGISGIAPKVELYAYRVLGAYGSGATSAVIAAIDKAVEEEMDIINLSLGSSNNNQTSADAVAISNATLAGVTAVIATGNSGPGRGTIGSPATSPLAISVGNSTLPEMTIGAKLTVEAGEYSDEYDVNLMGWTFASDPAETLSGTFDVVAIPGIGEEADYQGHDVEGKIALVSRGLIPFVDKIAAAKDAGAVGIIIHNNVEGAGPAGFLLGDSFDYIPTFDIATAKGLAFREAIEATENKTGKVTFSDYNKGATEGDGINDSSSRGPANPVFDIKPDVAAPGTNIMSTIPAYGKDDPNADYSQSYDRATGTSMAAPHVAGVAALLLSLNPEWTPYDVKVAISNTAKQLDTTKFDVFAQGPGRVQPLQAATAEALAYALDTTEFDSQTVAYEKGTVTFGRVAPNSSGETTMTKQIEVRSLAGVDGGSEYQVSVEVTKAATGELAGANVTVDKTSFSLNGTETLNVTLTVPEGGESPGNELLGYIHLTNGTTDLSLPFAAEFSTDVPTGLAYYYLDDYAISPNGDDIFDETGVNFGLYNDHGTTLIELWDASNPNGGAYGDGYLGYYIAAPEVPAGDWYLPIDDRYVDWGSNEEKQAPEGVYSVDLTSINKAGGITFDWDGPFYIKTSEPGIAIDPLEEETAGPDVQLTGTVTDKFVDFKSIVENIFQESYDVNEKLLAEYEVKDESDAVVDSGKVTLQQDGSFSLLLSGLASGEYTLTITIDDVAGNSAQQDVVLQVKEEEKPLDFSIMLTPSTTEPTTDPVTISVATDSEEALTALKWLEGEKATEDFANAGTDIDLAAMAFEVKENGTYTVYAQNSSGVEAVQSITVENITEPEPAPITITLTSSPTELTAGPVTITVETDSEAELTALKWLKGSKAAEDFAGDGTEIDFAERAFEVQENGMYTVYAQNGHGAEAVAKIFVANIGDPDAPVKISLTPSTTEPTADPVTITVDVESEDEIEALKWLAGEKKVEDFTEDGNEISLDVDPFTFEVSENGIYTVYVKTSAGDEVVGMIFINNISDPEPDPISISLSPSTREPTAGPVTITVETDSEAALTALKWAEGDRTVEYFVGAGTNIPLDTMSFAVTENGTYTVYAQNELGVETVASITIDNITDPEPEPPAPINITLKASPEEATTGPVTIMVETDSEVELTALKWGTGEQAADYFAEAGTDIALSNMSFEVIENGTYTVYAQNELGAETTASITISNIEDERKDPVDPEPEPEDPQKPEKPVDPEKPQMPKPETPVSDGSSSEGGGDKLPVTATTTYNSLAIGALLFIVGAAVLFIHQYRRKRNAANL
ncbi:Peptidase inhibitor I9 [Evansella caseinilytica]|uniref:Peptidase inhibitor I9 n=1 Tax=Evansella caseinilytica TaxID=1503961 RepID=A0A1H3S8A8_9BACI|nr:S8 family serine peptidase [Evansella caseinilytica]SDZ33838.1 Peptidase inhibitor I9 [Evansella caseinilytica]